MHAIFRARFLYIHLLLGNGPVRKYIISVNTKHVLVQPTLIFGFHTIKLEGSFGNSADKTSLMIYIPGLKDPLFSGENCKPYGSKGRAR